MSLIQPLSPSQAEGDIKAAFDFFEQTIGKIPTPMAMFGISPDLFKIQLQGLHYFMRHPTLGFALLSSIRFLVAQTYDYQFCIQLNKEFLQKQGLSESDIHTMIQDPESAPLEDKDRAMLAFVAKAVKSPDSATQADMDALMEMGWTQRDVLDAMAHAGNLIASSVLMKTFKLDMAC